MPSGRTHPRHRQRLAGGWLALFAACGPWTAAPGFDGSTELREVRISAETFLDLNANDFRRTLEPAWLGADSGWRMGGASISSSRLLVRTQLKARHRLGAPLDLGLELEQSDLFFPRPAADPLVNLDWYPWPAREAGFSVIGTPTADKRRSDLGLGAIWGRSAKRRFRLDWLSSDHFYNQKNDIDASRYQRDSDVLRLRATRLAPTGWSLDLDLRRETPLELLLDGNTDQFTHSASDYRVQALHRREDQMLTGIRLRSQGERRGLRDSLTQARQRWLHHSLELFRVRPGRESGERTDGIRYDEFDERLIPDPVGTAETVRLRTLQVYTSWLRPASAETAWDLGLYLGWSELRAAETSDNGLQAKLRTGWQFNAADGDSVLVLNISFNLDDFADDPGDGGGIWFQTRF